MISIADKAFTAVTDTLEQVLVPGNNVNTGNAGSSGSVFGDILEGERSMPAVDTEPELIEFIDGGNLLQPGGKILPELSTPETGAVLEASDTVAIFQAVSRDFAGPGMPADTGAGVPVSLDDLGDWSAQVQLLTIGQGELPDPAQDQAQAQAQAQAQPQPQTQAQAQAQAQTQTQAQAQTQFFNPLQAGTADAERAQGTGLAQNLQTSVEPRQPVSPGGGRPLLSGEGDYPDADGELTVLAGRIAGGGDKPGRSTTPVVSQNPGLEPLNMRERGNFDTLPGQKADSNLPEVSLASADDAGRLDSALTKNTPVAALSNAAPPSAQAGGPVAPKGVAGPVMTALQGDPNWNNELAGRVILAVKNGSQEASIQLSPPELGKLEIKISTEGDQARISFQVHNVNAKDAIEQAMPRLREMLAQDGLQLAHSEVSDHSQSQQRDGNGAASPLSDLQPVSPESGPAESLMQVTLATSDSVIDYYI